MLSDFAYLTHRANGTLVLVVVLGAVECTLLVGSPAVDGRVAGCADLKFSELVELNLHRVVGVALALRLDLACLWRILSVDCHVHKS